MLNIAWHPEQDVLVFPDIELALDDPDGLLMLGGNLSTTSLRNAYASGVFPWFDAEQPILWWSPSVRAVIPTGAVHISRNMRKLIRQNPYRVVVDVNFEAVIDACRLREQTWIVGGMREAYIRLHGQGIAHSVEVYAGDELVGGLYGVFIKNCFCGESMFSRQANTSKLALIILAQFLYSKNCPLIDCQLPTEHLQSMGAVEILREDFLAELQSMMDNEQLANRKWTDLWQQY